MRRGYKSWAEREALARRRALGVGAAAPLAGRRLADALGHVVLVPDDIPGMPAVALSALYSDGSSWSALTLPRTDPPLLILNPTHSAARQESDLMHELAHFLSQHEPSEIVMLGGFALRTYRGPEEEEAAWLGGCLQIPRAALVWSIARGLTTAGIAARFGASEDLVRWRRAQTGVDVQLNRRSRLLAR